MRYGRSLNVNCRFDYGSLVFVVVRGQPLGIRWAHRRFPAEKNNIDLTAHHLIGFGYATNVGPPPLLQTIIVVPMWFVTVLAAGPLLLLYRRLRKRRKTGFPIEPSTAKLS